MASDINTATIVGRLTRDVELQYTKGGTAVADMSIASNYRTKSGDNWEDAVSYIDCVLMGKRAEGLAQYLTKGTRVGITGELRQDRWQTKEGDKRSKVKVHVRDVQLLDGKREQPAKSGGDFDDDVPF